MAMGKGGGFGDLGSVMKQAQQMLKQREKILAELRERVEEGTAGGGMVTAYVNGAREVVKIKLEPEVVDPDDREMLEDLIVAAVNEASRRAQELADREMGKLTGGIPGMSGLLGG
jgi:DNA-binding YbaB/EbfC family protein